MSTIKNLVQKSVGLFGYGIVRLDGGEPEDDGLPLYGTFPTLEQTRAVGGADTYFIQDGYRHRREHRHFDDTGNTDFWQDEVYRFAREVSERHALTSVCDIGCGSGYKLLKYFSHLETIGIDVSPTYEWLCRTYPDRTWLKSDFSTALNRPVDLVLSADVIEHLVDPDPMMRFLAGIDCRSIVLATPDRDLIRCAPYLGPPANEHHIREWSFAEFERYVSEHFTVLEHFISNASQFTQCVLCEPKRRRR